MTIGERIKQHRIEIGMNLSLLARRSGMSRSYLHAIENDTFKNPSAKFVWNIAMVLGVTFEDLIGHPELNSVADASAAIQIYADQHGLTRRDTEMLAAIHYRGKWLETHEDIDFVYRAIKMVIRDSDKAGE